MNYNEHEIIKMKLQQNYERWHKIVRIGSYILTFSFISILILAFFDLEFVPTDEGKWMVREGETLLSPWKANLESLLLGVSFLTMLVFIFGSLFRLIIRKRLRIQKNRAAITIGDATEYFAWFTIGVNFIFLILPPELLGRGNETSLLGDLSQWVDSLIIIGVALLFFRHRIALMHWGKFQNWQRAVLGIIGGYLVFFFVIQPILAYVVEYVLRLINDSYRDEIISNWIRNAGKQGFLSIIIQFIGIVVLTPIAEEILCRGIIHRGIANRYGVWMGAIISSLFFTMLHVDPVAALPIFCLSLFLSYLYERYKTLWAPILFHALNNGVFFLIIVGSS